MNNRYISYLFRIVVAVYTVIATIYFLGKQAGSGDESLFISDIAYIESNGWQAAVEKGISIPHMVLAYPVSKLVEPVVALRAVNIVLFAGLLFYFCRVRCFGNWNFYFFLLFYYSTIGYFLLGTNETLFISALVIFFSECFFILKSEKPKFPLLFSGLIVAFFTRELFLVYAPFALLGLFLVLRKQRPKLKSLWIPGLFLALCILLNVPSLSANKTLSYDQKLPPSGVNATWAQRQYLAQLLVNDGKLENHQHPNWEQTDAYLEANGADALPDSTLSGMLFDWRLTLKEFFKDLVEIVKLGARQLGLILPIVVLFGLYNLFRQRRFTVDNFIPSLVLGMMLIFALIIISFVEVRWLATAFILAILFFQYLTENDKIPRILVTSQLLLVSALSAYGMYGLISKMW